MADWDALAREGQERAAAAEEEAADADDADVRQRTLTHAAAAAGAAGLALLMGGRRADAAGWLRRSADLFRRSWKDAPPGSWGRPIGALKALVLAGDWAAAEEAAAWPLEAGAATADSPIGRYAAALALLVRGHDVEARHVAASLRDRADFPPAVADALATLAAGDRAGYLLAVEDVLESFEQRDGYLEDLPVADTVLVLQALAERRDLAVELPASALLPGG